MIVRSKRDNYQSLYQYLTTEIDGVISPLELETDKDLDEKVEKMLNEDGYAKDDFIIIRTVGYSIDAKDYFGGDDEDIDGETEIITDGEIDSLFKSKRTN